MWSLDTHTHTQNYVQKTEKHRKKTLLLVSMHVTGKKWAPWLMRWDVSPVDDDSYTVFVCMYIVHIVYIAQCTVHTLAISVPHMFD